MDYSMFLFCNILRDHVSSFNELPFDEMYDKYIPYYNKFVKSEYNVDTKSEYDCMDEYIYREMVGKVSF